MPAKNPRKSFLPIVSSVLADGVFVELLFDREDRHTWFAVWDKGRWRYEDVFENAGQTFVPLSPDNALLDHDVVLFPRAPSEYGSHDQLINDIRSYIRRYVDLPEGFETIAIHYVILTWVYDCFNELPYLRVRGDYGSGKTRFLQTVGAICYRPMFVSGASTVSPIFHLLDTLRGTLVLDEADFRFSDEKAELVKILNNGNVRGMPVLRAQLSRQRDFEPRVFNVFGPKIIAMRTRYEDEALESRFLTGEFGDKQLDKNMPLNLPQTYREEALGLRNKLLMYRFRNWGRYKLADQFRIKGMTPRLNQILAPLLAVAEDGGMHDEIIDFVKHMGQKRTRGCHFDSEPL